MKKSMKFFWEPNFKKKTTTTHLVFSEWPFYFFLEKQPLQNLNSKMMSCLILNDSLFFFLNDKHIDYISSCIFI